MGQFFSGSFFREKITDHVETHLTLGYYACRFFDYGQDILCQHSQRYGRTISPLACSLGASNKIIKSMVLFFASLHSVCTGGTDLCLSQVNTVHLDPVRAFSQLSTGDWCWWRDRFVSLLDYLTLLAEPVSWAAKHDVLGLQASQLGGFQLGALLREAADISGKTADTVCDIWKVTRLLAALQTFKELRSRKGPETIVQVQKWTLLFLALEVAEVALSHLPDCNASLAATLPEVAVSSSGALPLLGCVAVSFGVYVVYLQKTFGNPEELD